jgi:hypothetical protein
MHLNQDGSRMDCDLNDPFYPYPSYSGMWAAWWVGITLGEPRMRVEDREINA